MLKKPTHIPCNRRTLRLAFHLFDRERRALLGGGPVLAARCCGNLGDAILKLTVGIAERLRRWQRRQFVRLMLFRPASQESNRVADAGARTIDAATDQLELRDQPVIAFQELIAFLGELLVEFFELVDPALQASDVAFERVHGVLIFRVLAPQLGIVLLKISIRSSSSLCNFFGMGRPSLFVPKKGVMFSVLRPTVADRTYDIN